MAAEARQTNIEDYIESVDADVNSVLGSVLQSQHSGGLEDSSDEDDDCRRDDHASAVAPTSPLREALTEVERMSETAGAEDGNYPPDSLNHSGAHTADSSASEDADLPTSLVSCTVPFEGQDIASNHHRSF